MLFSNASGTQTYPPVSNDIVQGVMSDGQVSCAGVGAPPSFANNVIMGNSPNAQLKWESILFSLKIGRQSDSTSIQMAIPI